MSATKYITPVFRGRKAGRAHVEFETGPYIGAIPLLDGNTLQILPRAGASTFWRMLWVAAGLNTSQHRFPELAEIGHGRGGVSSWTRLLAEPFLRRLQLIRSKGVRFARPRLVSAASVARGKVLALPTLLRLARGDDRPVVSLSRPRDIAIAENRLLGQAAAHVAKISGLSSSQRRECLWWARLTERHPLLADELGDVLRRLRAGRFAGPRNYYISALQIAWLIVSERGIAFSTKDTVHASPLLLNIRTLFEEYVRGVVQTALAPTFSVSKPTGKPLTMFIDGSGELIPDLVVRRGSRAIIIGDVKYKPGSQAGAADWYQLAMYLTAYRADVGVLVVATDHGSPTVHQRTFVIGGDAVELDVAVDDWQRLEQSVVALFRQLASTGGDALPAAASAPLPGSPH